MGEFQEAPRAGFIRQVTQGLKKSIADPIMYNKTRVLEEMLKIEHEFRPAFNYFTRQHEILPYMRHQVAQWMHDLSLEQQCESGVFMLAMNYLDRFLTTTNIRKTQLQLAATVCLLVASKLKQTFPLTTHHLVAYTDYSITIQELVSWESMIISQLEWNFCTVGVCDFIDQFVERLSVDDKKRVTLRRHALIFADNCYVADVAFSLLAPSLLAAAVLSVALKGWPTVEQKELHSLYQAFSDARIDVLDLLEVEQQVDNVVQVPKKPVTIDNQVEWLPSSPGPGKQHPEKPGTPTDVRDIRVP